ncbi:hypothetical protein ACIQMJ_13550 [Actinosynnema sp. NPDC091369]
MVSGRVTAYQTDLVVLPHRLSGSPVGADRSAFAVWGREVTCSAPANASLAGAGVLGHPVAERTSDPPVPHGCALTTKW